MEKVSTCVKGNLGNVQKEFCQALRDQQIGRWLEKKEHPKLSQGTHKHGVWGTNRRMVYIAHFWEL